MDLSRQRRDWEDRSSLDPYWAILSDPDRRFGGWDVDEFLDSGRRQIEALLREGHRYRIPRDRGRALDFGCGAGRLTQALSEHFNECLGLDISGQMIAEARLVNRGLGNCHFGVHEAPNLAGLETGAFDAVVSIIVLQRIPSANPKARYIARGTGPDRHSTSWRDNPGCQGGSSGGRCALRRIPGDQTKLTTRCDAKSSY